MSRFKFQGTYKDGNGRVVGSSTTADSTEGTISVYLAGTTTAASVYAAESGGTAVNSVETDEYGHFYFWVDDTDYAVNQTFKIVLSHSNFESKTYDDVRIMVATASVSDTAYAASWDAVTTISPSKNTVYDKIETLATKGANSNITSLTGLTTALSVAQGGTGVKTLADGGLVIGNVTGAVEVVTAGATTTILVGGGASTKPVWTTATGSGAPVRATSPTLVTPTLVTPALGTPSALVLTNATGSPINPWLIDIDVFTTPGASTNWDTTNAQSDSIYCGNLASDTTQNDEISWPVVLSVGTWTFSLMHTTTTVSGIYSVQFDTVEKGTIDGYSGSTVRNVVSTITSIAVAASGKVTLKLKMATKHASSSAYGGYLQHVRLIRTA